MNTFKAYDTFTDLQWERTGIKIPKMKGCGEWYDNTMETIYNKIGYNRKPARMSFSNLHICFLLFTLEK